MTLPSNVHARATLLLRSERDTLYRESLTAIPEGEDPADALDPEDEGDEDPPPWVQSI